MRRNDPRQSPHPRRPHTCTIPCHARFNRKPCGRCRRKNRVAIPLAAGHRTIPSSAWTLSETLILFSVSFWPAATIRPTSDPVAIKMMSGLPLTASARIYAPRRRPSAAAYRVRSSVGISCRLKINATGRSRVSIATRHANAKVQVASRVTPAASRRALQVAGLIARVFRNRPSR